jgi:hypothetical protein
MKPPTVYSKEYSLIRFVSGFVSSKKLGVQPRPPVGGASEVRSPSVLAPVQSAAFCGYNLGGQQIWCPAAASAGGESGDPRLGGKGPNTAVFSFVFFPVGFLIRVIVSQY